MQYNTVSKCTTIQYLNQVLLSNLVQFGIQMNYDYLNVVRFSIYMSYNSVSYLYQNTLLKCSTIQYLNEVLLSKCSKIQYPSGAPNFLWSLTASMHLSCWPPGGQWTSIPWTTAKMSFSSNLWPLEIRPFNISCKQTMQPVKQIILWEMKGWK